MSRVICNITSRKFYVYKCLRALCYSSQAEHLKQKQIAKVVNVAIIGAPNSGKSTLINNIVQRKTCASSNKVHTTTNLARAICYQDDTQIIFLDTPGVVTEKEMKKYNLPPSMIGACHKSVRCADVVGVVHDVSNRHTKDNLHKDVVVMLQSFENVSSFLILNKIDKLESKRQLLVLIHNLTNGTIAGKTIPGPLKKSEKVRTKPHRGYSNFSDVFLVSALNGDGVQDIKEYILSNAKPSGLQYTQDMWSDQNPEFLIVQAVRAKFLDFLSHEIPYNLDTQLEYFEEIEEENKLVCIVVVECPSDRLLKLISGAGGGRLNQIKSCVRSDLIDLFKKTVSIDIRLKVKNRPSVLE